MDGDSRNHAHTPHTFSSDIFILYKALPQQGLGTFEVAYLSFEAHDTFEKLFKGFILEEEGE